MDFGIQSFLWTGEGRLSGSTLPPGMSIWATGFLTAMEAAGGEAEKCATEITILPGTLKITLSSYSIEPV